MKTSTPLFSRKIIVIAIGLALIGTGAALSLTSEAAKAPVAAAAPVQVTVAPVVERSVTEWDDFSGRVQAVEYVEIRPRVAGTIDVIHFKEGQLVKKGDLLFTIDPRPFRAELARAEAQQAQAQAALGLSRTELDRTRRLIEEHAVAQRELDERSNAVLKAQAQLQAAEAAVMTARLNATPPAVPPATPMSTAFRSRSGSATRKAIRIKAICRRSTIASIRPRAPSACVPCSTIRKAF